MSEPPTAVAVPLDTLREQIASALANAKAHDVPAVCVSLGIQSSVEDDDQAEAFRSKRTYVRKRIRTWPEADLLDLAHRVLREYGDEELADTVSELTIHAQYRVSELVRRDVLKVIGRLPDLFGALPLLESLTEVFGVKAMQAENVFLPSSHNLQGRILRHYVDNETDWSHERLLIECGALMCSQGRFFSLLAKLLHPMVRRDAEQAQLAAAISNALRRDGFIVRQTGAQSGYALYSVARAQAGVSGSDAPPILSSTSVWSPIP